MAQKHGKEQWESGLTGRCPWCGEDTKLVSVMWFTKHDYTVEHVCARCKAAWLKRLRKEVRGNAR